MSMTKAPRQISLTCIVPYSQTPTSSPSYVLSKSDFTPAHHNYTPPRDPADVPTLYYSSSSSLNGRPDEVDEPYVIYSTPLPGSAQPSSAPPSPSPSPSPSPPGLKTMASVSVYTPPVPQPHIPPPPQAPSSRRTHGRMRSLSSIREEDECGA